MKGEHITSDHAIRPGLDAADRRVTILHREREASAHVGRPHPLVFARWHFSRGNQRLGAAADAAIAGAHPDHAFRERIDPFLPDFSPSGADIPKRFCRQLTARHALSLDSPAATPLYLSRCSHDRAHTVYEVPAKIYPGVPKARS